MKQLNPARYVCWPLGLLAVLLLVIAVPAVAWSAERAVLVEHFWGAG